MTARHANELLYDSEAALRLVDSAIEDLRDASPSHLSDPSDAARVANVRELLAQDGPLGSSELSQVLAHGYGEIVSVLGSLRQSRTVLDRTTGDKGQQLNYASLVLLDMEARLAELASILDPAVLDRSSSGPASA